MELKDLSKEDWGKLRGFAKNEGVEEDEIVFVFDPIKKGYLEGGGPTGYVTGYLHSCLKDAFEVPFVEIPLYINNADIFTRAVYLFRLNLGS